LRLHVPPRPPFTSGGDPVRDGLVASLGRPGGNATGVAMLTADLTAKRLELLHELLPDVLVAVLVNPSNATAAAIQRKELEAASRTAGVQVLVVNASTERDIDLAFTAFVQQHIGALLVAADQFFFFRRDQIVTLAAHYRLPGIYEWRDFVEAGGLMSYGTSPSGAYRRAGTYVGRILQGEKAAELSVQQSCQGRRGMKLKNPHPTYPREHPPP